MFRKVSFLLVLFAAAVLCAAPVKAKKAKYTPPALSNPASWSMVVVPDVQTYTRFSRNHGILDLIKAFRYSLSKKHEVLLKLLSA